MKYSLILCLALLGLGRVSYAKETTPALVVVVSVDQWRYEYIERFDKNLDANGITRRVQQNGLLMDNCFHQHAFTFTGPGHSVLMTGAYPNRSGIIDNNWFDRDANDLHYCVYDPDARIIGSTAEEDPVSPRNLLVDTVGDQLKMATGRRGKVLGVAIKDRAAILMAGRLADAAYWMSSDGKWVTTTHYQDKLPGYLRNLNEQRAPFRYEKMKWLRLHLPSQYTHGVEENSQHELPIEGMTTDFPHEMPAADDEKYIKHLACSPFGNDATFDAAREIVVHESLGKDEFPDILAINLSATDYVGHAFGPYSLEVEDMFYRTDVQLGNFAKFVDDQLDGRPWAMFLTADHGVAPIPERASEWGLRAKRNPFGKQDDNGNFKEPQEKLEGVLRNALNVEQTTEQRLVQAVVSNQVFLHGDHPALRGSNIELARRIVRDWLVNNSYVAHAATRDQLVQDCSTNEMLHMMQRSFHARRSGDVLYALKPYTFSSTSGAQHGSPWRYDRHVPLMILPNGMKINVSSTPEQVSPASIAPTIARMLHIESPSACAERRLPVETQQPN